MIEFAESHGWVFHTQCNCQPPRKTYRNAAFPDFEVDFYASRFVIKKRTNSVYFNTIDSGNSDQVYDKFSKWVCNF